MSVHAPSPPETEPTGDDEVQPLPPRRWLRRRRPGPPAAFAWRWLYPLLLAGLAVAVVSLTITGSRLVLDSRDGRFVKIVQDPTKPGYFAQVVPTPTVLVVQTNEYKQLVGAIVMSLSAQESGGWALLFPAELIVPTGDGKSEALVKIFEDSGRQADGIGGLRSVIARLLGANVDTVVQADATAIGPLIAPVAPIRVTLTDQVRIRQNGSISTLLKSGPVEIRSDADVAAMTEVQGYNEASAMTRFNRQAQFWQAWIDAVRAAPDKSSAFPSGSDTSTLVRFVKGLASGTAIIERAPYSEGVIKGATLYVVDEAKVKALALQMIPYPVAYEPGARVRVDVRNGVGRFELNEPLNRKLVAAGAQITVLGNAAKFDVARTSVVYYDPEVKARAEQLARAIGATDIRLEERESDAEVTVTIGADFVP